MPIPIDIRSVQVGHESAWGTAVAQTAKLMGVEEATITPLVTAEVHPELRADYQPGHEANLLSNGAEATLTTLASYEDVPYYLDSLAGQATPSGGGPYTYAYSAPTTSSWTRRDMTVALAASSQIYSMTGGIVKALTFSGEKNAPLRIESEWIGQAVTTDTTDSLSDRDVTYAIGDHAALYIDTAGGTIGSTQITDAFFNFELNIDSNVELVHSLGALTASGYREARWSGELSLVLELTGDTDDYLVAQLGTSAFVERQIRIEYTSGTNVLQLNYAGVLTETPEIFTDEDGTISIEYVWMPKYNSQLSNWFTASIDNGVSSLA